MFNYRYCGTCIGRARTFTSLSTKDPALWVGRNAWGHGRKAWEPGAIARYISRLMEDLTSLKQVSVLKQSVARSRWERPALGWIKVNTDAGFNKELGTGSVGVVIRDHAGRVAGEQRGG